MTIQYASQRPGMPPAGVRLMAASTLSSQPSSSQHTFASSSPHSSSSPQLSSSPKLSSSPMPIRKVAILGAGTMGSRIAAHLANAGLPVVLLDIVPEGAIDAPGSRSLLAAKAVETLLK